MSKIPVEHNGNQRILRHYLKITREARDSRLRIACLVSTPRWEWPRVKGMNRLLTGSSVVARYRPSEKVWYHGLHDPTPLEKMYAIRFVFKAG